MATEYSFSLIYKLPGLTQAVQLEVYRYAKMGNTGLNAETAYGGCGAGSVAQGTCRVGALLSGTCTTGTAVA